jgi:hypothetical protein
MLFSPSWATIKVNFLEDLYLALINFLNTFILSCLLMFIANDVVFLFLFFVFFHPYRHFYSQWTTMVLLTEPHKKTYPYFTFGLTNGFVPLVIISTTMAWEFCRCHLALYPLFKQYLDGTILSMLTYSLVCETCVSSLLFCPLSL